MPKLSSRNKLVTAKTEVVEGYKNGLTIRQLGEIHKVSPGTIRNCLISNGVTLRRRGRKGKTPKFKLKGTNHGYSEQTL